MKWLRTALAVMTLCFALGTIAHAGHHHEADPQGHSRASELCNFCASFSALIDAPAHDPIARATRQISQIVLIPVSQSFAVRTAGSAQPRAPPAALSFS